MIELQPHAEGWLLPVRAIPGARRDELRGEQNGALKLSVTSIAEKGQANAALRDLLAQLLRVRRSQIELFSGATSNQKRFLVREMSEAELQSRLDKLLV